MNPISRTTLAAGLLTALTALAAPAARAATAPATDAARPALVSGVERATFDAGVRAQDDFFRASQGGWLKTVDIPADRASWTVFAIADEGVQAQLRTIITGTGEPGMLPMAGSDEQKVGDFYASFVDLGTRNALGLAPLRDHLAAIEAIADRRSLAVQVARFNRIGVGAPLDMSIHQDNKDSTRYVLDISQSGLGLPNRDYYLLADDARMAEVRGKYLQHLANLLVLAGQAAPAAAADAAAILALETGIARAQWSAVDNRDAVRAYNKLSLAQLDALAPGFDWPAYLAAVGAAGKLDSVIVSQPSYVSGLDALIAATPLPVLKAYLRTRLLSGLAPFLSEPFVAEQFAFNGRVLSGAEVNRPLEKRAVLAVNRGLGEIVGKLYVARYFPAERKQQVEAMVGNFLAAFRDSIETLEWMGPATRKEAQVKLSKISVKVGYPDKWRDYSALSIGREDLVGNVIRSRELDHARDVDKLGRPIDRDEWHMTPQTVNAYYSPEMNEIVFPAARLQAPLYLADAEPAVNYGGVGISIGHEISHAFDDQGSQYDGDGNLRDWWTQQDRERFSAKGKVLVAQYNGYSPLPGYTVNGELTLGENIADNAGAIMALRAYRKSLGGRPSPVIDGFSGEQRLMFGLAQARRGKAREPALIAQIKSDPHSPPEFRVNGALRNHPGFYEAFSVQPGDGMYLAPENRVLIW